MEPKDTEDIGGLGGLYSDLCAIEQHSNVNLERICFELEAHLPDFRKLLDKTPKNNASRQTVLTGKISSESEEYEINSDFQQGALQLADALNIDEIEAAFKFLKAQRDGYMMGRSPLIAALMMFHEHRSNTLSCLRLIFRLSLDYERPTIQTVMQTALTHVLGIVNSPLRHASEFVRKALKSMIDIEEWISLLGEQLQKATTLDQELDRDIMEAIEYQQSCLKEQHESLGAIVCYMFKGSFTSSEDVRFLVQQIKQEDRFDGLLIHYVPAIIASFFQYGSPDGPGAVEREARDLNQFITATNDPQGWKLPHFHAAVTALWLSVYSGWYFDGALPSSVDLNIDVEKESKERTKMFKSSLDDGALDFMLSICAAVNNKEWADPARSELVALLLKESVVSLPQSASCSDFMKELLMENFEVFIESCVANMPDAVRHLKSEEDSQRLDQITALRDGLTSSLHRGLVEVRTYLESFLMIISFAFECRAEAAQEFWADPESNLYGFLQWASKRQTVPRVSAFCEMLCSISEGPENAAAAHQFLTEEDKFMSSKFKRSTTMNWSQMFAELQLHASRVTEKPNSTPSQGYLGMFLSRKPEPVEMNEPESPVMLTCYLRLMGHLCSQSEVVRDWMLQNQSFNVVNTLLTLCSGPIPSHLRATAFTTLAALMTERSSAAGHQMWMAIDEWLSGGSMSASGNVKVPLVPNLPVWHQQQALKKIGESFDQTNAFVVLVNALFAPPSDQVNDGMSLPYPVNLGGSYRMPGVGPYIDFILGHAFSRKVQDLNDHQTRLLTYNCLEFVVVSLKSFNENLVLALSEPSGSDHTVNASLMSTYVVAHPFARVVEWLFNEDVLKSLFAASQQDTGEICVASSDSVVVLTLLRSLEVMTLLLDLQSTYLNVVKSIVASQLAPHRTNVANSSLASFEDSVLSNLSLIPLLCLYCSTGHLDLAITSMQLLERLTSSRKLNKMASLESAQWRSSNKIVEVLASELDVDSVSKPLVFHMTPDIREFDYGPEAASYVIRENILALLRRCLGTITDRPTVAHLLLGFKCVGPNLETSSEGLFAEQSSLLHAIVGFLKEYPEDLDGTIVSWVVILKRMAFEVLKHLWSSKLAGFETLSEMRSMNLLQVMFAKQPIIDSNTMWSGFTAEMDDFWLFDGAAAMREFLYYRSFLFEYAAAEIRSTAKMGSQTLHSQTMAVLLGNTVMENGQPIQSRSVFDLFDFADLGTLRDFEKPALSLLEEISNQVKYSPKDNKMDEYNFNDFQALVRMRDAELPAAEQQRFRAEVTVFEQFMNARNHRHRIQNCHYAAFKSWAELISTMIACSDGDEGVSPAFILHCLQLILPQLEAATDDDLPWALELAKLAETLISRSGDAINEKLYHLFQICIQGINLATGHVLLRETYYMVCTQYVTRITTSNANKGLRRESQHAITKGCPALVETICDDALNGQDSCRASALLLLNGLAVLDSQTDCVLAKHISEANCLSLFLDSLRSLPVELHQAQGTDTPALIAYYESLLSLLQRLSQTKKGATYVLDAGLFQTVRDSQLFAADPDIGIDIDNPNALQRYYDLLLSVMRVIVSAVFSRGIQNQQIIQQTRTFLAENRSCMVGIFKRSARIGNASNEHQETLGDLNKSFISLVSATGFTEAEEQEIQQTTQSAMFS
ncbi:hypothetical protein N7508_003572 [Penicillium antarcticum]|uniref:uncharacterized protein n=1 Tax=Penicillium antarcticum TaxID=416450 RepID=UPI0023A454FD|nr:uncharacterized protein N7508_003572 [Penicillium antarcticum]KAJ5312742.1 hypothetical protein N7508_003572 [Penicillium antarcticum]